MLRDGCALNNRERPKASIAEGTLGGQTGPFTVYYFFPIRKMHAFFDSEGLFYSEGIDFENVNLVMSLMKVQGLKKNLFVCFFLRNEIHEEGELCKRKGCGWRRLER